MAAKTATADRPRLRDRFDREVKPTLQRELGLTNVMQVPRFEKIVVNVGVGPEAAKICHALLERDVCTDYRGDGLRISPHFFNTEDDIDRCFEELRSLL